MNDDLGAKALALCFSHDSVDAKNVTLISNDMSSTNYHLARASEYKVAM